MEQAKYIHDSETATTVMNSRGRLLLSMEEAATLALYTVIVVLPHVTSIQSASYVEFVYGVIQSSSVLLWGLFVLSQ